MADDGSYFLNIKEHCDDGQRNLYVKDLTIQHVREWGWLFVDELCWKKQAVPGLYGCRFKNGWEPVFHFTKSTCKTSFDNVKNYSKNVPSGSIGSNAEMQGIASPFTGKEPGMALPSNVIEVSIDSAGVGTHSARYPVALPEFFIKAYSDKDDLILDPFLGSGTTLIAAARQGRKCYGMEISPAYCDVIRKRWTAYAKENGLEAGSGAL